MMHESGTGGAPKYGVVAQLPVVGNVSNPLLNHAVARSAVDEAGLGWYRAHLANGVVVELSASRHAGIIRHSFPVSASGSSRNSSNSHTATAAGSEMAQPKNVLVDVSHFLPSSRGLGIEQHYVEGAIAIDGDGGDGVGRYTGYGTYNGGWNYGAHIIPAFPPSLPLLYAALPVGAVVITDRHRHQLDHLLLRTVLSCPSSCFHLRGHGRNPRVVWDERTGFRAEASWSAVHL